MNMTSRLLPPSRPADSAFTVPSFSAPDDERTFGRFPGMLPPIDMFPDRLKEPIEVQLAAIDYFQVHDPLPRDGVHWMLRWRLQDFAGCPYYRMIQVVTERLLLPPDGSVPAGIPVYKDIYTNWGPMTKSQDQATIERSLFIPLCTLTLEQRKELEKIAENEPVCEPNGKWNCQDWLKSVMWKAVEAGLFEKERVEDAISIVTSDARLKAWLNDHKN